MKIPFVDLKAQYLSIQSEMDTMMTKVVHETAFIGGTYVKQFEAKFAELYGVKHVISCANGTDSLYIIMRSLGIGAGDEVITAANSWISSSETIGQTGVEMEALTAVQVALLTIYDMCKAADRGMTITDVKLLEKQGGKSGHWVAP